jgi:hypothetical protein
MLSSITRIDANTIPLFSGNGFKSWVEKLCQVCLMAGLVDVFDESLKPAGPPTDLSKDMAEDRKECNIWREKDQRVQGLILERVSASIAAALRTDFKVDVTTSAAPKYSVMKPRTIPLPSTTISSISSRQPTAGTVTEEGTSAVLMLAFLEQRYGQVGALEVYRSFMDMLEIRVPEGTNPQQGMDRLSTAYEELAQNAVPLPEFLRAAFIVRALPPSYGSLSTWLAERRRTSCASTM